MERAGGFQSRPRPQKTAQHELVKTHDVLEGWISTNSPDHGRVPVAYVSDASGKHHFDWQYVIVSKKGLDGLTNKHVEPVALK